MRITPAISTSSRYLRASQRDGGRGLGLAGDVEHQHHRPAQQRRQVGGGAGAGSSPRGGAVEQSHHAFGNANIRVLDAAAASVRDQIRAHRPAVEIVARPTGGDLVEGRIDIIGTAFERLHDGPTAKRAQQPERHGGFAGTRTRRSDDEAGRTEIMAPRRSRAPPPKPALIGGVVERAFAKIARGQHLADQDQRGAVDAGLLNLATIVPSVARMICSSGQLARNTTATGQSSP